ncbi:MAG: PAS domain-containing protein [Candidatus Competibacteraceae bacterium]
MTVESAHRSRISGLKRQFLLLIVAIYLVTGAAALGARLLRHTRHLIRVSGRIQEELNHLNENLREREEKYRSLFENAHEGIFIARLDGQFLQVNPAMTQALGCPTRHPDTKVAGVAEPHWPICIPAQPVSIQPLFSHGHPH